MGCHNEQIEWLNEAANERIASEWGDSLPCASEIHKKFYRSRFGSLAIEVTSPGRPQINILYGESISA